MKDVYDIDDLPEFKKNLNKHKKERVNYEHDPTPVKRGRNIENTVIDDMQCRAPYNEFCPVSDIIAGVCRLDHYNQKHRNTPLSQNRMYNILQCMEVINTREVKKMLDVSDRQAQIYLKACRIAIPFLESHFEEHGGMLDDDELGIDFDQWNL